METLHTWWATELYPMRERDQFGVSGEFEVVLATDAQATIAALQAQLKEQSEKLKYHDLFKKWQCWRDPDELVDEYEKWQAAIREHQSLKDQLTQRTAELEAAKHDRDELQSVFDLGHTRTVEADKLWQEAHGKPEVWPDLGDLVGWLIKRHDDVQAELERAEAGYFVAERDLRGMNNKYDELRTLVAALPKVEGDWTVSCALAVTVVTGGIVRDISEVVAAIVQHRQGMEG